MKKRLSAIILFFFTFSTHQNLVTKSLEDVLQDKKENIAKTQAELEDLFNKGQKKLQENNKISCEDFVSEFISFNGLKEFLIKHNIQSISHDGSWKEDWHFDCCYYKFAKHFWVKIAEVDVLVPDTFNKEFDVMNDYIKNQQKHTCSINVKNFIAYRENLFQQKFEKLKCSEILE